MITVPLIALIRLRVVVIENHVRVHVHPRVRDHAATQVHIPAHGLHLVHPTANAQVQLKAYTLPHRQPVENIAPVEAMSIQMWLAPTNHL